MNLCTNINIDYNWNSIEINCILISGYIYFAHDNTFIEMIMCTFSYTKHIFWTLYFTNILAVYHGCRIYNGIHFLTVHLVYFKILTKIEFQQTCGLLSMMCAAKMNVKVKVNDPHFNNNNTIPWCMFGANLVIVAAMCNLHKQMKRRTDVQTDGHSVNDNNLSAWKAKGQKSAQGLKHIKCWSKMHQISVWNVSNQVMIAEILKPGDTYVCIGQLGHLW